MSWGWSVHMLGDHFPEDAQRIGDPEWMEYGLAKEWSLLTQDMRIATQPSAQALLRAHRGVIHCLDSAELPPLRRAEWFHGRRRVIYQRAIDRRIGFYVVHEKGVPRRKR